MGLKTTNYEVKNLGITVPNAYARLTNITINLKGEAFGVFEIHQNREDITKSHPLERIHINTKIDKEEPIYSQMYIAAKKEKFSSWEDDIIEEVTEQLKSEVE